MLLSYNSSTLRRTLFANHATGQTLRPPPSSPESSTSKYHPPISAQTHGKLDGLGLTLPAKTSSPPNLVLESVLSSPPKNGCIAINPISFTFLNSYSHAFTATWHATLPPALSLTMKNCFKLTFEGISLKLVLSSMNFKTSNSSSY